VQFLIPVNGVWVTLADQRATAPFLLDHYVNPATHSEEVCAAALWVHADGEPWNSPEHSEFFDHVAWWMSAVTALLEGETSADIWAWEESGMHATREGDLVVLEEQTHHVDFQLPPVCFELRPFALELLIATRAGVELESELIRLAEERYSVEWKALIEDAERAKAGLLPISREAPDPKMDEFGRRLFSATGRQLIRLMKEWDREMKKRRKADPEGFAKHEQAIHLRRILQKLNGGEMSAAWKQLSTQLDSIT
jgi:hypothetical protein